MEELHLTPRELLQAIARRLHWVLLAALLGGTLGFCLCRFWLPPQYTATGSLYVSIPGSESADPGTASAALTAAQKLVNTCLVLLESDRVLDRAAQQIAPDCTAKELRSMLSAACLGNTEALSISVTHRDPQTAMGIANAILDTAPAEILRIVHTGRIEVVDRAVLPVQPDAPTPWQATALGGCVTGLSAGLAAALAGFRDKRKRLTRLRRRAESV